MRRKASFTSNPLAFPQTPIHRLASRLQNYLHFPDPYPLYILMAALVANYANGRPVWLMLVGPPSCGKSELLNSLLSLPQIVEGGSITGPGALLSATRKKDRAKDATGGLLREIGDRGALVIKEFTSILSLPSETMRSVLGAFREVYDGRWTRKVGTDGGNDQHWSGKMALLTGCTESIDHHHSLVSDMGERFVFYRYESSEGWSEAFKALSVTNSETLSDTLQALVCEFALELGLDWDYPPDLTPLDTHDKQRLIAFSQFCSNGRSAVIRDPYTKEIVQASMSEYPIRLSVVLGQLLRSLRYIGVDEPDCWSVVRKVALDSIPGTRRLTLLALLSGRSGVSDIADHVRVSQTTVRRSLEELQIHNMVDRKDVGLWSVSDWAKDRLYEGCNGTGLTGLKLDRH
jgi:DNA-binding transcriptional ArsR family regulator